MSEEARKLSAFEAFQQTQLTFAEAEEKAKQEAGTPKVERFRIGEDGEYPLRILPLAPSFDAEGNILPMDRKGYEYSLHQFFLAIKVPSKKGKKSKKLNIPVIRATDKEVGYSIDIIDTYVKIAKEMYADDADLLKKLGSSAYEGGIRWNYQHAIMVLDTSSDKTRAKGPQLWQCSHSQYKDIDAAKMRLWKELREEGQETCPISGLTDAYPVKIIRTNNNGKTEYTVEIGRKVMNLTDAEVETLLDLPRIPELIYRYTRYQLEATLVFLQQYDEEHDMEVCEEPDFKEAVEKLKGELPADDQSHFDLAATATKSTSKEEITIDSLWAEYDDLVDRGLNEKSNSEYQDFREKLRQFIEDKGLDVRISHSKNNHQILEEIDTVLDEAPADNVPAKEEEKPAPSRRAPKPKVDEPVEDPEPEPAPESEPEEEEEEPQEQPRRSRRARPGSEPAEEPSEEKSEIHAEEEKPAEEEAPRRRLHSRRMR